MAQRVTMRRRLTTRVVLVAMALSGAAAVSAGVPSAIADGASFACTASDDGVSWTSTGATNYHLRQSLGGDSVYVGSTTDLTYATDARYGTFTVISYTGGRQTATCIGPGGPTQPSFTCSVDDTTLSWSDQGVDRYYLRRSVDGVDGYIGSTTELSHQVEATGIYTVITWTRGVKFATSCAGVHEDRPGPQLVWNTNNTKPAFRMNLLRTTVDPSGDFLSVANVVRVSGPDHLATLDGHRLAVDPELATETAQVVYAYDVVGEPGIVYKSTATINVAQINASPIDEDDWLFANPHSVLESRTGLKMTIQGAGGGFDFGHLGGIAAAPGGRIVVADTRNHRIQICSTFDSCDTFGAFGDRVGDFYLPVAVAMDSSNDVWIGDVGNQRIQRCNQSGTSCVVFQYVSPLSGQLTQVTGHVGAIAFPDDDHIVFGSATDLIRCRVDGTECLVLGPSDATSDDVIVQIAVQPNGRAFVATAAGSLAMCENVLHATDAGCVSNAAPGHVDAPVPHDVLMGVASDTSGGLIVSDTLNQRLLACGSTAGLCRPIIGTQAGPLAAPQQLVVDANGLMFVVDIAFDIVQVMERRGVLANAVDADTDLLTVAAVGGDAAKVGVPVLTELGALITIDVDGGVTYDPTGSATLQALAPGQTVQDVVAYTVSDGRGGTTTSLVTIGVTG